MGLKHSALYQPVFWRTRRLLSHLPHNPCPTYYVPWLYKLSVWHVLHMNLGLEARNFALTFAQASCKISVGFLASRFSGHTS